ncbi:hypothetical protein CASFOL_033799 [Castilleja foliolosa]|uniref:SOSEKI DIX-like domain-containing protein n=1 Tax=Castilleja foliolosa TaxID=1961234 RepID=A0ABD3BY07_9LAMI
MEAQGCSEVRRLHIVYFLSRKGKIEHPHLVRVHHHSRNGVHLRDVKRWLGELRGKDLPESYSWSYKRKYKTGYVWQDLLDDDLINPISDNEYVLKGSEISNFTIKDEKVSKQRDQFLQEDTKITSKENQNQSHNSSETSTYISTKSSSEIEQESLIFGSESSTLTDDSINSNKTKQENEEDHQKTQDADKTVRTSTFYSSLLSNKKNKKKANKVNVDEKISPLASEPQLSKGSNGPTNILRNLINCGPSDTNDSAVVAMKKQSLSDDSKPHFMKKCSSELRNIVHQSDEICKRDHRLGGSQRVFGTPSWTQQQYWSCGRKSFDGVKDSLKSKIEQRDHKAPSVAYMPVNVPNCSQCGKPFKPEKLHAHMKICKGMKAIFKTAAADVDKASKGSKNVDSVSSSLLAH